MNLLLAELIETYKNKIAAFTGENVVLGMPDDSEPGLYFLPYHFSLSPYMRNTMTPEMAAQTFSSFVVKCLLIPSPQIDYVILNKGFDYINSNPFFNLSNGSAKVTIDSVSTEELTSLFISAGSTYRLSVPFHMQYMAN